MDTWHNGKPDHGHETWEEYAEHSLTHANVKSPTFNPFFDEMLHRMDEELKTNDD